MDVYSMLANANQDKSAPPDDRKQQHTYPTRYTANVPDQLSNNKFQSPPIQRAGKSSVAATAVAGSQSARGSPTKKDQKHVVFQLIDPQDPRIQARLPMRVMISVHDTTDSIIATVKNFYGLYDYGVSFENKEGFSIIAAYDNFENDMTVYVRTVLQSANVTSEVIARVSTSPKKPTLGAPFEARPSLSAHSPSRSAARSAGTRSMSPASETGRRSVSAAPGAKVIRPAKPNKSKDNSTHGDADGYSSDDGANVSVTSSRRSKTEQVNAEISVDNIVEGGRRKRAFESSELPLFVPPQMPISASISSISPQRRSGPVNAASPLTYSNQHTFSYTQPLPSPQSHGNGHSHLQSAVASNGYAAYYQPPRQLRGRPSGTSLVTNRLSTGSGILPTPDPTVGSAISDEDVALQLMRLGDASNFSYGRTSTSTVDDALSGKAEAPSSDEDDDDDDNDDNDEGVDDSILPAVPRWPKHDVGPQRKKQRVLNDSPSDASSGDEYDDHHDTSFKSNSDELMHDANRQNRNGKPKLGKPFDATKPGKPRLNSMSKPKTKPFGPPKIPMSPASMAPHSRKASIASSVNYHHHLGPDEDDLSTKPRCQRCRKSKKGCDRQRPCGRCKDAGIGADGCLSEDEGNGRKGRYGRHMGVPVKKAEEVFGSPEFGMSQPGMPNGGYFLAPAPIDKSKKRKR